MSDTPVKVCETVNKYFSQQAHDSALLHSLDNWHLAEEAARDVTLEKDNLNMPRHPSVEKKTSEVEEEETEVECPACEVSTPKSLTSCCCCGYYFLSDLSKSKVAYL